MSDKQFDVTALVKEAREYADAEMAIYESAKIGEKPSEDAASNAELFGELAEALESLSARVTQAEAISAALISAAIDGLDRRSIVDPADPPTTGNTP